MQEQIDKLCASSFARTIKQHSAILEAALHAQLSNTVKCNFGIRPTNRKTNKKLKIPASSFLTNAKEDLPCIIKQHS